MKLFQPLGRFIFTHVTLLDLQLRAYNKTSLTFIGRNDSEILKSVTTLPIRPRQPRFAAFRVIFLMSRAFFKPIT